MIKNIKFILNNKIKTVYRLLEIVKLKKNKPLFVVFVPDLDIVNGGILSLNSIYNFIKNERKEQAITSFITHRITDNFLKFSMFDNNLTISSLHITATKIKDFEKVIFLIPELYVKDFNALYDYYFPQNSKNIFNSTKEIEIDILNQNEFLMPDSTEINKLKSKFKNITISVAHHKYLEKNKIHNLSTFHLPAWLNVTKEYLSLEYKDKQNIIAISPDDMEKFGAERTFSKADLIGLLQTKLPHFKVIVIDNLPYKDYKNLMLNAKYLITLGEGLDGYFMESSLSGSVPFAVKNEIFFEKEYLELPNLFESFDDLYHNIISVISELEKDSSLYSKYNLLPKNILTKDYNYANYTIMLNKLLNHLLNKTT